MTAATDTSLRHCRVTALIPAFNAAQFIGAALESIFEQNRPPHEIIVVDDCSTDNTAEIVRGFTDRRLNLLTTAKNSGSAIARNLGIQAASGDFIAFLDADDLWLPHHCSTVAGLLEQHTEAALAFSRTSAFGDTHWTWPLYVEPHLPVDCFWQCLRRTIVPQMNVIARRTALLEVGGYRPELRQTQDFDLFLRLAYRHKFVCTDQVTTQYRRHAGSITARNPFKALGGEYISRHLFWQENHASMDEQTRERFEQVLSEIWLGHVREAWDKCDVQALSFHLSQHDLVAGSQPLYASWKKRKRLVGLKKAWESLPTALRSLVYTAVRPLVS